MPHSHLARDPGYATEYQNIYVIVGDYDHFGPRSKSLVISILAATLDA